MYEIVEEKPSIKGLKATWASGSVLKGNTSGKFFDKQLAGRKEIDIAMEISGYTGFRTTVLEELTEDEAIQLLDIHCPKPHDLDAEFNALKEEMIKKEYRSKILAIAEREGIKKKDSWAEFNNFMLLSSKFKKGLNEHSLSELKELLKQFNALATNNRRSAEHPMTKAWFRKSENLKHWN